MTIVRSERRNSVVGPDQHIARVHADCLSPPVPSPFFPSTLSLPVSPLAILLGQMRLSHEEIKLIIVSVDDSRITEQMLQQLLKFLPGTEQISQFQGMRGIMSELSEAERFGVVVSVLVENMPNERCWVINSEE